MADLQSLLQAFQALGIGTGSVGSPTTSAVPAMPTGGGGDLQTQLMQLLSGAGSPTPAGGGGMLQAIQAMGNDPRNRSAAQMPNDTGSVPVRGNSNYNAGAEPMGMNGPATDQDLTQMLDTSDSVRRDLPPAQRDGYTGEKEGSGKRPVSTEEELADVQKRMGASEEENTPSKTEIDALKDGRMSPMEFDKKYGEGSADDVLDEKDEA